MASSSPRHSEQDFDVSAVIVTWNPDIPRLTQVLTSLVPQTLAISIVDNASLNYQAIHDCIQTFHNIALIQLHDNLGIASALNIGIQHSLQWNSKWILTLDQDTVIYKSAIECMRTSFYELPLKLRNNCGILAMRSDARPSSNWLTRYSSHIMTITDLGSFVEKLAVVTSGNLIRTDISHDIHFNETLFIDQVDFDFCVSIRERGYRIFEYKESLMDHQLGTQVTSFGRVHAYENAERLYYIFRNSTFLVLRRRLPIRYYIVQLTIWSGAYISTNGYRSLFHYLKVVGLGIMDGARSKLGPHNHGFLHR